MFSWLMGSGEGKAPEGAAAPADAPAAAPAAAPSPPAETAKPAEEKAAEPAKAPEPAKDAAEAKAGEEKGKKPKKEGKSKGKEGKEGKEPKGKEGKAGKAAGKGKEGKGKDAKGKDAKGKDSPKGKGKEKGPIKGSGPTAGGSGYRLNVKNLGKITEEELKELFAPFGTVSMAEIKKNDKGESRGFGFVVLPGEKEGAAAAKEMNGKEVKGTKLNVAAAERRATEEDDKGKGKGKAADVYAAQVQQAYAQQWAAYTHMMYMQQYQQYAAMQQAPSLWAKQGAASASQEYEGSLKSVSSRNGYGFIVCKDTYDMYGRDVYVDGNVLPQGAARGSRLAFTVKVNEKGHPLVERCRLVAP